MFAEARTEVAEALTAYTDLGASVYDGWPKELQLGALAVVCRPLGSYPMVRGHGQKFRTWDVGVDVALLVPTDPDPDSAAEVCELLLERVLGFVQTSIYGFVFADALGTGEFKGGQFTHTRVHLSVNNQKL